MQNQKLYNKYLKGKHWEDHPIIYAERFSDFLKKEKFNDLLIDIGCGSGRDVNVFVNNKLKCKGIDNSKDYILSAIKEFPNCNFEVQNAENLNFKDSSIGAVFMINVIHYLNKEKAINEILRVLKPKGFFFIHFNISIIDINGKMDYSNSEEEILNLVSKFKILEKNIFERVDLKPVKHTHKIMELILQKP